MIGINLKKEQRIDLLNGKKTLCLNVEEKLQFNFKVMMKRNFSNILIFEHFPYNLGGFYFVQEQFADSYKDGKKTDKIVYFDNDDNIYTYMIKAYNTMTEKESRFVFQIESVLIKQKKNVNEDIYIDSSIKNDDYVYIVKLKIK